MESLRASLLSATAVLYDGSNTLQDAIRLAAASSIIQRYSTKTPECPLPVLRNDVERQLSSSGWQRSLPYKKETLSAIILGALQTDPHFKLITTGSFTHVGVNSGLMLRSAQDAGRGRGGGPRAGSRPGPGPNSGFQSAAAATAAAAPAAAAAAWTSLGAPSKTSSTGPPRDPKSRPQAPPGGWDLWGRHLTYSEMMLAPKWARDEGFLWVDTLFPPYADLYSYLRGAAVKYMLRCCCADNGTVLDGGTVGCGLSPLGSFLKQLLSNAQTARRFPDSWKSSIKVKDLLRGDSCFKFNSDNRYGSSNETWAVLDLVLCNERVNMERTLPPRWRGRPQCDHYKRTGACPLGLTCLSDHDPAKLQRSLGAIVPSFGPHDRAHPVYERASAESREQSSAAAGPGGSSALSSHPAFLSLKGWVVRCFKSAGSPHSFVKNAAAKKMLELWWRHGCPSKYPAMMLEDITAHMEGVWSRRKFFTAAMLPPWSPATGPSSLLREDARFKVKRAPKKYGEREVALLLIDQPPEEDVGTRPPSTAPAPYPPTASDLASYPPSYASSEVGGGESAAARADGDRESTGTQEGAKGDLNEGGGDDDSDDDDEDVLLSRMQEVEDVVSRLPGNKGTSAWSKDSIFRVLMCDSMDAWTMPLWWIRSEEGISGPFTVEQMLLHCFAGNIDDEMWLAASSNDVVAPLAPPNIAFKPWGHLKQVVMDGDQVIRPMGLQDVLGLQGGVVTQQPAQDEMSQEAVL